MIDKRIKYLLIPDCKLLIRLTVLPFTLRLVGTVSASQQLKLVLDQEATPITFAVQLRSRFCLLLQIPGNEIYPNIYGSQQRKSMVVGDDEMVAPVRTSSLPLAFAQVDNA
ncbi:hypothetical protein F2Q69_00022699 [Brassica cretica]|uniref:Uncharacterized protein n=1 Tax=Brassica cretica TaxID=69181 RepID=A0A8S9QQZ6_BRACR|nr:hypothetical protein F2Q69_00022699 [Brassica cretica]